MNASDRIVVNTAAQYIRTIINVVLSMYATRLILGLLGEVDYGIYTLVAGVVAMLSFVSNALVVSTQRFLSFYQGKGDTGKLRSIFNDSVILHLFIGLVVVAVMLSVTWLVFNGNHALDIPQDRLPAARNVYFIVVAMLFVTLMIAPFRASLISHEDIVYISVVDVLDGIMKVLFVIALSHISVDSLVGYACVMLLIQLVNFLALALFAVLRYDECSHLRPKKLSGEYVRELASFAGWTVYSTGCIVGRTQGTAILVNKFFSIVANSAFGIALQVSGFVSFVSDSLLNAMRPQIMKAEGGQDREHMLRLSCISSKVGYLLLALIALPVMFYIGSLLDLWLVDVPESSDFFCCVILVAALADVTTIGLGTANQAIGKIREYSLVVNTTKLLTLPVMWLALKLGASYMGVAICYAGFEFLCAMVRIPFLHYTAGLDVKWYFRSILLPLVAPTVVYVLVLWLCSIVLGWNMFVSVPLCAFVYVAVVYALALSSDERSAMNAFALSVTRKIMRR